MQEGDSTLTPIAELRDRLGLKIEQLAEKLECSKGHASDLCSGRRQVSRRIAEKLSELDGRPWHEWMAA